MFRMLPILLAEGQIEGPTWEMLQEVIEAQRYMSMFGIAIMVGVAALVVGGSWAANFFFLRRRIDAAIGGKVSKLEGRFEEMAEKLKQTLDGQMKAAESELATVIQRQLDFVEGEMARLHARDAEQEGAWGTAALWWARAIEPYAKAEQAHLLRVAVNGLQRMVKKEAWTTTILREANLEQIKSTLEHIPAELWPERDEIRRAIEKAQKEKKEEPKTT